MKVIKTEMKLVDGKEHNYIEYDKVKKGRKVSVLTVKATDEEILESIKQKEINELNEWFAVGVDDKRDRLNELLGL